MEDTIKYEELSRKNMRKMHIEKNKLDNRREKNKATANGFNALATYNMALVVATSFNRILETKIGFVILMISVICAMYSAFMIFTLDDTYKKNNIMYPIIIVFTTISVILLVFSNYLKYYT